MAVLISVTEGDVTQIVLADVGVQGATGPSSPASGTPFTPYGNIAATNVQTAIQELDDEKFSKAGGTVTGSVVTTGVHSAAAGSAAAPSITFTGDTNTGIYSPGPAQVAISTGGTEKARIDSSGRLLVGTSTARSDFNRLLNIESLGTNSGLTITRNNNDNAPPVIEFGKTRSASIGGNTTVANNDFLGYLRFYGADGTNLSSEAGRISCEVDGTPGTTDMPGRLVFSTTADGAASPTERMRIGSNGKTAINHADNDSVLYLQSSAASGYTEKIQTLVFAGYAPNNTAARFLYCADTAAVRAEIRSNGGLANFQANNVNLSDRNVKKDISPAAGTWDCIKEWEIVNYRYKDQPVDAGLNLGVIAQQVAESCPEVITIFQEAKEATDDAPAQEERLGVKEQQMYWMAIKALQEAQVRIEQLESKVAALESA
jgi:hypothetical protein